MAKGDGVVLRECRECHLWFPPERRVWCDLCRRWFCVECHRDTHVWRCPKNK